MRSHLLGLTLCLAAGAAPLAAQERPARWMLHLGVSRDAFTGASTDTSIPGTEVEVVPAPRLAVQAGLRRRLGNWEVGLAVGFAVGALRALTNEVILDDRTSNVNRYRVALQLGRRLTNLGAASLHIIGGPSVDHWDVVDVGERTTIAGQAGLALRIPLGGLQFENAVRFGLGGSPFKAGDLPAAARPRTLRTWSVGVGVGVPL
jgi:hypothetical protein